MDQIAIEAMELHQAIDDLQKTSRKKIDKSEMEMAERSWEEEEKDRRQPKQWWVRRDTYPSSFDEASASKSTGVEAEEGSIIPINLSVNHLQLMIRAPGSPNEDNEYRHEEFLPVVIKDDVEFRWRSQGKPSAEASHIQRTTAYRILLRLAHSDVDDENSNILWDSDRVETPDGLPDVVKCASESIEVGSIYEWRVTVWDGNNQQSTSSWSKFAVGPESEEFTSKWITHPVDMASWSKGDAGAFWNDKNLKAQQKACDNWNKRKQLPIFRARLPVVNDVQTALLVVSGLGSFRSSVDGIPLSSSGPLDPPLTDYAQRVSYRGFDITSFMTDGLSHVIGIASGSGWWDHRPIKGSFIRLFLFPHGPNTINANVIITYKNGTRDVILPTGSTAAGWQVSKGHLRESSLFTGEYIDLGIMSSLSGWDTIAKWSDVAASSSLNNDYWKVPTLYESGESDRILACSCHEFCMLLPLDLTASLIHTISDTTLDVWRYQLHVKSNAMRKLDNGTPFFPEHKIAPIGKLVPHEAPPVMPMAKIYPDEVYSLGDGRWMIDFGVGFSGVVRFENGLPEPIIPDKYPRGHSVSTLYPNESFITVIHGERLELSTGGELSVPFGCNVLTNCMTS